VVVVTQPFRVALFCCCCSDGFGGWQLEFWLDSVLAKQPLFLRGGDGVVALMVEGGADMEVGY
jgi:hypothetical protein